MRFWSILIACVVAIVSKNLSTTNLIFKYQKKLFTVYTSLCFVLFVAEVNFSKIKISNKNKIKTVFFKFDIIH